MSVLNACSNAPAALTQTFTRIKNARRAKMRHTESRSQRIQGSLPWPHCLGLAILTAMFALVIYLLSSAPAFVVALKSEEELSFRIVRRVYRPLFDVAPEFTSNYLRYGAFRISKCTLCWFRRKAKRDDFIEFFRSAKLSCASIAYRLYSRPCCRFPRDCGSTLCSRCFVGRRFFHGQSIDATMVNASFRVVRSLCDLSCVLSNTQDRDHDFDSDAHGVSVSVFSRATSSAHGIAISHLAMTFISGYWTRGF